MTDFDKLDKQYRDEGWAHITDDALPGVRPSNVESQARAVATWCVGRIAALEAQLDEKVKVKPLEWRDESGSEYEVRWDGVGIGAHYVAKAVKYGDLILCCGKYHTDISKAKAAAQADYERRILSALEATPPAPKVTEAEAAAKLANAMWGITLTAAQESGQ